MCDSNSLDQLRRGGSSATSDDARQTMTPQSEAMTSR